MNQVRPQLTHNPQRQQQQQSNLDHHPVIATTAIPCPQCRQTQSRFYCQDCLNQRFISHVQDLKRVGAATDKAALALKALRNHSVDRDRDRVRDDPQSVKGNDESRNGNMDSAVGEEEEEIQDPFGQQEVQLEPASQPHQPIQSLESPYHTSHQYLLSRALHSKLQSQVSETNLAIQSTISTNEDLKDQIQKKAQLIERRKENLRKATSLGFNGISESSKDQGSDELKGIQEMETIKKPSTTRSSLVRAFSNPFSLTNYNYYDHQIHSLGNGDENQEEVGVGELETEGDRDSGKDKEKNKESDLDLGLNLFDRVEKLKGLKVELEKENEELWKELIRVRSSKVKKIFQIFQINLESDGCKKESSKAVSQSIQDAPFVKGRNNQRPEPSLNQEKIRKDSNNKMETSRTDKSKGGGGYSFSPFGLASISSLTGGAFSKSISPSSSSNDLKMNPKSKSMNLNEHVKILTMNQLRLPLPTLKSLKSFKKKEEINTSILYLSMVLELFKSYLDLELPFSTGWDRDGRVWIERNWFWNSNSSSSYAIKDSKIANNLNGRDREKQEKRTSSSNPSSSKNHSHSLYLSSSNFNHLQNLVLESDGKSQDVNAGGGMMGNLGASTFNLGASTLSSFESFIQLPGRDHFTWGRASVMNPSSNTEDQQTIRTNLEDKKGKETSSKDKDEGQGNKNQSSDSSSISSTSPEKLLNSFLIGLTMLNYNVFYLAKTQGVELNHGENLKDLNMLEILQMILRSKELGFRSCLNPEIEFQSEPTIKNSLIKDLEFKEVDFDSLLAIYDPSNQFQARDSSRLRKEREKEKLKEKISNNGGGGGRSSKTSPLEMEKSYVDAGKAAESVLLISQKQGERERREREKERIIREKERDRVKSKSNSSTDRPDVSTASSKEKDREKRRTSNLNPNSNSNATSSGGSSKVKTSSSPVIPSNSRPSAAANARLSSNPPLAPGNQIKTNLDFLRNKGQKVAEIHQNHGSSSRGNKNEVSAVDRIDVNPSSKVKTKPDVSDSKIKSKSRNSSQGASSSTNKPANVESAPTPSRSDGAVIFNGIEIKGKDDLGSDTRSRKNSRKKLEGGKKAVEEEDWDVL